MRRTAAVGIAVTIAAALAPVAHAAKPAKLSGEITVLAASSLTEAFTKIEARFEERHPDADVVLSFGSSSAVVTQIQQGAPADVVATADEASMERLVDRGHVAPDSSSDRSGEHPYTVFVRNRLEIAVAPGNPLGIESLADTLEPDVTLVLCAPEVPCGKYALEAYDRAGLDVPDGPTGASAKDTITKVALGEADAAVVYVTDVQAARDDVDGVEIAEGENVLAAYPIAPVVGGPNAAGAKAFIQLVLGKPGQRILRAAGFVEP